MLTTNKTWEPAGSVNLSTEPKRWDTEFEAAVCYALSQIKFNKYLTHNADGGDFLPLTIPCVERLSFFSAFHVAFQAQTLGKEGESLYSAFNKLPLIFWCGKLVHVCRSLG